MPPILVPLWADDPRLSTIWGEIHRTVQAMPELDPQRAMGSLQEALRRSEGLALYQDGVIIAFILYYSRGALGRITFVYALQQYNPDHAILRLVAEAVHHLGHRPGVQILRCDFSPWGADHLSWALLQTGFRPVQRATMRAEGPFTIPSLAALPAEVIPWHSHLTEAAAQLLYEIFSGELDGMKDPAFASLSSCRQLINETIHGRFGLFDPSISFLLAQDGKWVGMGLASWTINTDGFIPALGLIPEARGQGLGKAVVGELLRRFAYASAPAVELAVTLENQLASQLYQKMGFHFKETFTVHYLPVN